MSEPAPDPAPVLRDDRAAPPPSGVGVLRPLRIPDFRRLWIGMFVSLVGDGIYFVAMAWQVFELSNRPSALALVGLAWSLPQVLLVLLSGVLADRLDRRKLMILGDVIRMVAITAVGYLSITGDLTLTILIVLVVIYGVGQAAFQPAFQAIVPDIVPEDLLVEANSLDQFVRPFAITLVGPMIGGLVIGAVGVGWAFLLDAGTFLWSAFAIWMIRTRRSDTAEERKESVWSDALAGLRYVARTRWLLVGMVAATLSLFAVWGPWESLVPFVVKNDLGGSAVGLGVVYAAGGVGSVSVALILGQRGKLPRRAMTWLYATWAFGMFATAGFGVVTQLWQAMLVALAAEASISALIVIWITVVQRLVPADLLGRVFSLDWMISITGVPLSFAFVGPLADSIGADATLILAGVVGGTVTLLFMLVPGARGPEQDGSLEAADPKAAEAPG